MNKPKSKLYRKVNTKTFNVRHEYGGDFKNTRHGKHQTREKITGTMGGKKERGLDYTPLFKFLLSRVGKDWSEIFSEAKARLDKTDPIFWLVALNPNERKEYVRYGESSYFSGLYVDELGVLQLTNPNLKAVDMVPFCNCCTHTFNGIIFGTE